MAALHEELAEYHSTVPMDEQEARACIRRINEHVDGIDTLLLELYSRYGWRALGHDSFAACCEKEIGIGRAQSYKRLKAARARFLVSSQEVSRGRLADISTKAAEQIAGLIGEAGVTEGLATVTELGEGGKVTQSRVQQRRPVQVRKLSPRYESKNLAGKLSGEQAPRKRFDPTDQFDVQERFVAARCAFDKALVIDAAIVASSLDDDEWNFTEGWLRRAIAWLADVEAARAKGGE